MTKKPKPKFQRMTEKEREERFNKGQMDGFSPSDVFGTPEAFKQYMKDFKKAFMVDDKLHVVINLVVQNLLSSIVSSMRPLVINEEIDRKSALIFFSLFADRQKCESIGSLLEWSLNTTNLCREADVIPKGVYVLDNDDDDGVVVGLGVSDECSDEDTAKLLAQFDGDGFSIETGDKTQVDAQA